MKSRLICAKEVADILGCSEKTVYRHGHKWPGFVKIAGNIRFNLDTLMKWTQGSQPVEVCAAPLGKSDNPHRL